MFDPLKDGPISEGDVGGDTERAAGNKYDVIEKSLPT